MKPTSTLSLYEYTLARKSSRRKVHALVLIITIFSFIFYAAKAGDIKANNGLLSGTESMRINLYLLNNNTNGTILADGVLVEYNDLFQDSVTLEDAYKFTNINENLGIKRYSATLAVERRPIIVSTDTIYFKLWKTTQRYYQLEFIATNLLHPGMQAILQDSYLGTNTPLSFSEATKLNFFINSNPASSNINRFRVVYQTTSASSTLPVTFSSVKGYELNNKISIDWKVENEINISRYEIEHSVNGKIFTRLNTVNASLIGGRAKSYASLDEMPAMGNNFYRIKSIDLDGSQKYSSIVKVVIGKTGKGSIGIYPNPITGKTINLQLTNQVKGLYQVRMTNGYGQVVYATSLMINSANITQPITVSQPLPAGIYQVSVLRPDNSVEVIKAIVQE